MKKIGFYILIFILVILFRNNICFFYGNVLGVFKLDNNINESIIKVKDEKIEYLENEIDTINSFSKDLEKISYNYKVSKIIYKNTYNTSKYTIQYGKEDKVTMGLGITNEYGLVGKITSVDKSISEFTILKDLKDVSVMVHDSVGKLNYDNNSSSFIITDISNYDKVYVNDEVYTSGYGSIKEKLYIGKVISIENKDVEKKIYVKSNVDFNNLNYVLIVGDFN